MKTDLKSFYDRKFLGRDVIKRPTCPFCGLIVERPVELTTRRAGELPLGSCSCGAVYACDESGRNVGSAQVEALVFACDMDWDLAWDLLPDEDYRQEIVERYDLMTHLIIPGGFFENRRISGVLFFVRLHEDVLEVTAEGVRKRLERARRPARAAAAAEERTETEAPRRPLTKQEVENYVGQYRMDPLLAAAPTDRKLIRTIQRLLYTGDEVMRRRAAEALGRVSAVLGETNPGAVSRLLQGFIYSITDTAASSWGAFEAVGEIIRHQPEFYGGYLPQLFQFLGDPTRRASSLEAIASVAEVRPELLRRYTLYFQAYLSDEDPAVRGHAARLMGSLGAQEMKDDVERLIPDGHEVDIYEQGEMKRHTVGQLAREALRRL
ncbi:MAG: DVU0298 family protein [Desulfobacteraceae bacterium]